MNLKSTIFRLCRVLVMYTCMVLLAQSAVAQTTFTDNEFDVAADWSVFGPYATPADAENAAFGASQMGGANPYMEVDFTRATVSSGEVATWGALINDTLVWDPAEDADGALAKLDLSFFIEGGGAWSLAVEQDGFVWMAVTKRFVRRTNDPATIEIGFLYEEDFVALPGSEFVVDNQPMHPDFSVDAPPIAFGLGVGFSCPTTSNCTVVAPLNIQIDDLEIHAWQSVPFNAGHNGNWWAGPQRNGEGLQAEIADSSNDSAVFIGTVYSYNALGQQIFLVAVGPVDGGVAEVQVFITDGGRWGDDYDPEEVSELLWGTGVFRSCGCDSIIMDLRPNEDYISQGFTNLLNYELVRLTTPLVDCPYVQAN